MRVPHPQRAVMRPPYSTLYIYIYIYIYIYRFFSLHDSFSYHNFSLHHSFSYHNFSLLHQHARALTAGGPCLARF